MDYELVDHTGDMAFRVSGPDRPTVFRRAAAALFDLVAGVESIRERASVSLDVAGAVDIEDLLVRFLSELLYLHDAEDWLFRDVRVLELADTRIRATAHGERLDADRHRIRRQVKAVTYHGLRFGPSGEGWEARVVLDL